MFQYILFDLDGTLSDSAPGICKSIAYACEQLGYEVPSDDLLRKAVGPPLSYSFSKLYGMPDDMVDIAIAKYRERYSTIGIYENTLYEGMKELLEILHDNDRMIVLASSKPVKFVNPILEYFGIKQYFNIIAGSDVMRKNQTKTDVMKEALERIFEGVEKKLQNCVMVGDRCFDVEGAKNCKIPCIGVKYGYAADCELEEAGADIIVETVQELKECLLKEN